MNDFAMDAGTYDWVVDDSTGVIDLVCICGADVVGQNIKTFLARYDGYDLLTNEDITLSTRAQILEQDIKAQNPEVESIDMSGFNPVAGNLNCREGYNLGTICPVINCENSAPCVISI